MKSLYSISVICACGLIFAAGCNKTDQTNTPTASPAAPQAQSTGPQSQPATPTAPMPAPDAPKDSAGPKPGQANDHSNPEFKAGGKEVRK